MGESLSEKSGRGKRVVSFFVSRQTFIGLMILLGAGVIYTLGFAVYAYWKYPDPGPLPRSYIFVIAPFIYLILVLPIALPPGIAMVLLLSWLQRYRRWWRWQWITIGGMLGFLGGVVAILILVKFFSPITKYETKSFEILWALIISTLTGVWYSIKLQE